MVFGSCLLRAIMAQPLASFTPARHFFHLLPPSLVWKTPRSSLSSHKCPVAQASTSLPSFGFTRILAMCTLSFRPTFVQFSPPSVDLYTPSPTDTLLRVQASPEPTQTIFEFDGSIATAPIDCTSSRSNTGLYVVPPFTDFQTPPLAAPMKTVIRPSSSTASTAAMRPLMVAEPMFRAGNPETVAASKRYGACAAACKDANSEAPANNTVTAQELRANAFMFTSPFPRQRFSLSSSSSSQQIRELHQ